MQCSICLGQIKDPVTVPCCQNKYCRECLSNWQKIRNVCPLCCAPTGDNQINNLKKIDSNEQFDDGLLIIQNQMKQLNNRFNYVLKRVINKRQLFQDCKSTVPRCLMQYIEQQAEKATLYQSLMHEQYVLQNRAGAVEYMQLLAQSILNIQNGLDNKINLSQDEQEDYEDCENQCIEEYYYDYEEQFEQMESTKNSFKSRKDKMKQKLNQVQKNKTIK